MIKSTKIARRRLVLEREAIRILGNLGAIKAGVQTSTGPISMDDDDACSTTCPKK